MKNSMNGFLDWFEGRIYQKQAGVCQFKGTSSPESSWFSPVETWWNSPVLKRWRFQAMLHVFHSKI